MSFNKSSSFISVLLIVIIPAAFAELPSLQKKLELSIASPSHAAIVADIASGTILASTDAENILNQRHAPASLMKVFTLISFISENGMKLPVFQCPATMPSDSKGCWDRKGHGEVDAEKALAFSCNVYFRQLAQKTSSETFKKTLFEFGLTANDSELSYLDEKALRTLMVGSTLEWKAEPARLLRAYCALTNGGYVWPIPGDQGKRIAISEPVIKLVRSGLRRSAMEGTSLEARKIAGVQMLGKTGTSLLVTDGRPDVNRTQGLWIGMYPADHPEIAILTIVREGRGATDAAPLGGRILSFYLESTYHK